MLIKKKIDEDYEPTKEEIAEQERIRKALADHGIMSSAPDKDGHTSNLRNLYTIISQQFLERYYKHGSWIDALYNEREYVYLGIAVGLIQGTVGIGGGF